VNNAQPAQGWRTVDIVVSAVIAVAFGVIFWAWSLFVWGPTDPFFQGFIKPAQYILSGVYLMPAVLGGLVIRKPGAALFTELVAAAVSALLGSQWGLDVILSGLVQGAGAELIFAFSFYRGWTLPVAALAAVGAAVGEWVHDMAIYYPETAFGVQLVYGGFMLLSAILIAGIGSWLLTRALADTGVLAPFPSGRTQRTV
jgi:energy-coupling factor transport system substrate-specific component